MIEATVKYPAGHSYTFQYEKDEDIYCPNCGREGHVWCERGLGDYYVGPSYYCGACTYSFTIQCGGVIKRDSHYFSIIKAIRKADAQP